jgi:hypothetical protein
MTAGADRLPTGASPAGSWSAEVGRPGGTSLVTFHFTPDGRAFLLSGGAGRWTSEGGGRFSFHVAEAIVDPNGFQGWVHIEQHAVRSGSEFTSAGTSVVHDAAGGRAYEVQVEIVARRVDRTH